MAKLLHMTITREIALAAAWDVGNKHARAAGRSEWNAEDYNAAACEFNRLLPFDDQQMELLDIAIIAQIAQEEEAI